MILAQVDAVKPLAEGLGSNFLPWALAIALIVIAYLAKVLLKDKPAEIAELNKAHDLRIEALQKSKDEAVAALQAQLLAQIRSDGAELRKTLESVLPAQARMLELIDLVKEGAS